MASPPTSKQILTSIISSLQRLPPSETSTSTAEPSSPPPFVLSARPSAKPALLTLHFLFPHELLPALDLIDRRLLTRLYTPTTPCVEVFYVQSASTLTSTTTPTGRFRNAFSKNQFYEVRLDGWNCSCPAFAYSTLRLVMKTDNWSGEGKHAESLQEEDQGPEYIFGGTSTKRDPVAPVCKHILAVALAKGAPRVFGSGMMQREVSAEEIAGWAAGWGEH